MAAACWLGRRKRIMIMVVMMSIFSWILLYLARGTAVMDYMHGYSEITPTRDTDGGNFTYSPTPSTHGIVGGNYTHVYAQTTPARATKRGTGQAETGDCGWSFQCRVDCPTYPNGDNVTNVSRKRSYKRTQHVPVCDVTSVTINVMTRNDTHIPAFPFNDICLPRMVDEHCYDDLLVPRVVHYVWFGKREMGFYHFLSFWSAYTFLKPCFIFVHSDYLPFGDYWDFLLMHVPNLIHVNRSQPLYIYGTRVKHVEHSADLVRLEALQAFGGIYIDTDVIILRPFEPLRRYNFTLSREMSNSLSNALIISVRNATFSSYWLKEYRHFYADQWADHSTLVPARLAKAHKDDIHIEEYTFYRPDWTQAKKWIYQKNYVWKTNYAMHLYIRQAPTAHTLADIRTLNTTLGSVARFTLFGIKELCIV